jgi:hypothetical protein
MHFVLIFSKLGWGDPGRMGHHFVPQRYLRNFEDPNQPDYIWVHDRRGGPAKLASIAKLAQSRNFYSQSTETILAQTVEQPANPVLQKLTTHKSIDSAERFHLAYYTCVMMKRIPAHRRHSSEMLPDVLANVVNEIRSQINALAHETGADPEILKKRGLELDAAERKYRMQPPPEVLEQIREPWPSREMVELLFRMTWRVLVSTGPIYFVTTDNPAFFFRAFGLGRERSELSFPLSTHYALHASWQKAGSNLMFIRAEQAVVKEINRRLVSEAERLVFHYKPATWVSKLLSKKTLALNSIQWQKG